MNAAVYIHKRGAELIRIRAWNRGYAARLVHHEAIDDNPYHPGAACLWESWRAGWQDAAN